MSLLLPSVCAGVFENLLFLPFLVLFFNLCRDVLEIILVSVRAYVLFPVESVLQANIGFRAVNLVTGKKEILAPTWHNVIIVMQAVPLYYQHIKRTIKFCKAGLLISTIRFFTARRGCKSFSLALSLHGAWSQLYDSVHEYAWNQIWHSPAPINNLVIWLVQH